MSTIARSRSREPAAFVELKAWAAASPRLRAVQSALVDQPDALKMNLRTEHSTSSSLLPTSAHCETPYPFTAAQSRVAVRVQRLDNYIDSLARPPTPDWLLKVDLQGFETFVLRGAPRTLSRRSACIMEVSLDELYLSQSSFTKVGALMAAPDLQYDGNFQQMYRADRHVEFARLDVRAPDRRRCFGLTLKPAANA
jgi:FkbM family methyltransferase